MESESQNCLRYGTAVIRRGPSDLVIGGDPLHQLFLPRLRADEIAWLMRQAQREQRYAVSAQPGATSTVTAAALHWILAAHGLSATPLGPPRLKLLAVGVDLVLLEALRIASDSVNISVDFRDERHIDHEESRAWGPHAFALTREMAARHHIEATTSAQCLRLSHWDFAVCTCERSVDPARYARVEQTGVSHVAVVHNEESTLIGPLTSASKGPCIHCWELRTSHRDPYWAINCAQIRNHPLPRVPHLRSTGVATILAQLFVTYAQPPRVSAPTPPPLPILVDNFGIPHCQGLDIHPRCTCTASTSPFVDM
ncbi:hypothetical protein [Schaalia suimastitidis]|uniref:hypothetical protein n=1 Tax=Schaalia suimastitidis TaxID=121163 RepID=UPI00047A029D|nr:hypothetical protein [Schaalia suimastitidis]